MCHVHVPASTSSNVLNVNFILCKISLKSLALLFALPTRPVNGHGAFKMLKYLIESPAQSTHTHSGTLA